MKRRRTWIKIVSCWLVVLNVWLFPGISQAVDATKLNVSLQQKQLEQDRQQQSAIAANAPVVVAANGPDVVALANLKTMELQYAATQLDVNNVNLSLTQVSQVIQNARKILQNYREQRQELLFFGTSDQTKIQQQSLDAKINNQKAILRINQQRQEVLLKTLAVLNSQLLTEKSQLRNLKDAFNRQHKILQQETIEKQVADLNQQQNYWLKRIISLNKALTNLDPQSHSYQDLAKQLFLAQENSNLLQITIGLTHDQVDLLALTPTEMDVSVTTLNQQRQDLDDLHQRLKQSEQLISDKMDLLQQRQKILQDQGLLTDDMSQLLADISQRYQQAYQQVQGFQASIEKQQLTNTEQLAKALARRQGLPGFSWFEWYMLGQGFIQMEVMIYQAAIGISKAILVNVQQLSWLKGLRLLLSALVLSLVAFGLRHLIYQQLAKHSVRAVDGRSRFTIGVLRIIRNHLLPVFACSWFLIFLLEVNIGSQWLQLVFYLLLTSVVFSVAFATARSGLYENLSSNVGDDVRLYFRLFWTLVFGAAISFCLVISQQLNAMYEVQDFFNRAFAFFILVLALMLLKAWKVVPQLIVHHVNTKHAYLIRVIKLLGVIVPLIILSNAIIGIVGYVELAWTISKYEGVFVWCALAYLVAKGMLNEGLTWLADYLIGRFRAGWLLTEAVLKPLAKWLHMAFFLSALYLLLFFYGITDQAFLAQWYFEVMHFTLLRFSTTNITLWVLIKATLVALVFMWAVRWSREFCYRRLYVGVKDIGARNSLAIFTQYGMALVGLLVTLKVLQIDLTGLAFVFSGFAVGIGFGLRDLANNFSCGLLLLIERPMRRGDTVTIGQHEGVVAHIGMRAITLISPDNGEVVVPNSEAFSKIFINWTRQDDVVRCEVIVKVSREEDPTYLHDVIKQAVSATEGILEKPMPVVLLKSLQDTVLEFEVRFHINYRVHDSRTMMKSRVLFNVWQSFKALGVKAPHPQQDIHVKEWPALPPLV